ncbi:MAG TPA: hypothetical protein VHW00_05150 [Thermoanaerobaculia bacterium]|nr:hypothetical protein [Thermoanaerobaculia bacterium]
MWTDRSRMFLLLIAALTFSLFAATDGLAQGTTECKACGVTCTPTTCYENCIRMTAADCAQFGMTCAGVCYTYFDWPDTSYHCRVSEWYPCYY